MLSSAAVLNSLLAMLKTTAHQFNMECDVEDIELGIRQVTALALVAHELVLNAMKYGRKSVRVTLSAQHELARLTVEDDGTGLPQDFDYRAAANTGLTLVDTLTHHDLGGTIRFDNRDEGGVRVSLELPSRHSLSRGPRSVAGEEARVGSSRRRAGVKPGATSARRRPCPSLYRAPARSELPAVRRHRGRTAARRSPRYRAKA